MVALLKKSPTRPTPKQSRGVWQETITGGYHPITTHQLAMAWWLYQSRHITKKQLRIFFAAFEMKERRRHTKIDPDTGRRKRPSYTIEEVQRLVGGGKTSGGSGAAMSALSAEVKALGRLGLVKIMPHKLEIAVSIDQISLDDVSGFWAFFEQLPNKRRPIPVPRRTIRALAGGFQASVMGLMIALLIRCLFWHKGQGAYRVDGCTKAAWLIDIFGLGSERTITAARARLVELGWLSDVDSPQWILNRYGKHEQIIVDAFGPARNLAEDDNKANASGEGDNSRESATPRDQNPEKTATPCLNSSPLPTVNDLKTRRPALTSGSPGDSREKEWEKSRRCPLKPSAPAVLHNIVAEDLRDNHRLLELHRQAIDKGMPVRGEAGRLDFFALAERARAGGNNPPKLFAWLLKGGHFDRISIADEEAAAARIRELHYGPRNSGDKLDSGRGVRTKAKPITLTADDRIVIACIKVGRDRRIDPFRVAQSQGWTQQRWEEAYASYQQKDRQRWEHGDAEG